MEKSPQAMPRADLDSRDGSKGSRNPSTQAWREPVLSSRSSGAPSDAWLQEHLAAERAELVGYLEWRHERLLNELRRESEQHKPSHYGADGHAQTADTMRDSLLGGPKPSSPSELPSRRPSRHSNGSLGPKPPLPPLPLSIEDSSSLNGGDLDDGSMKIIAMDEQSPWQPPPQPTCAASCATPNTSAAECTVSSPKRFNGNSGLRTPNAGKRQAWDKGFKKSSSAESVKSGGDSPKNKPSFQSSNAAEAKPSPLADAKTKISFVHKVNREDDFLHRLVTNPQFELALSSIIMANALVMSVQIQWQGLDIGHSLQYRRYESVSASTWPGAGNVFGVLDFAFGVIYACELVIKVLGQRLRWVCDPWNYMDLVIVSFWVLESLPKASLELAFDSAMLRVVRLFRLLRLIKVLRTLNGFDSLFLLMTTLKGSLWALGWSCVLLFVLQMMIAMGLWSFLKVTYFDQSSYPLDERREVFEYFGTFARVMLTMFEMTLANWPPVCRLLVEYVSEWFMVFFILHKLTIGFAVIGVINGVFMQETFKVASTDDRIMMRQKQREVKVHTQKMQKLFSAADDSGDGVIDIEEFRSIVSDPEINMWLSSMDIPVRDPDSLYSLLDVDGDGGLTCEELVKGAMRLRGAAKSIDVVALRKDLEVIRKILLPEPATESWQCTFSSEALDAKGNEAAGYT